MNHRPCEHPTLEHPALQPLAVEHLAVEHLGHYERNDTYLRVLLAVPTEHDTNPAGPAVNAFGDDEITIDTARIVILTAPNLHALDHHTARLQTAAAEVDWELRPADGLHRRIIERLRHQSAATETER